MADTMSSIEERAKEWAMEYLASEEAHGTDLYQDLMTAYMAGAAQAQKDYSRHFNMDINRLYGKG
jgi:hypothetical protein